MKDTLIKNVETNLDEMFDFDRDGMLDLEEQWEQRNFIGGEDSDDDEDADGADWDADSDADSSDWDNDGDSDSW